MRLDSIVKSKATWVGLSAALLATASPVWAADAADQPKDDKGQLDEIVVTAQHRQENLRLVPIAVNAVTADTLQNAGVANTSQLTQAVPSLNFTRSGPSGIFVIRGVATPNGAAGEEGSTAVYVDDVYMADLASTVNTFNNIERIEVLNGPQGTLFGRNATGGLIRVITKDPSLDHTVFNGQMGYGNYEIFSGQAYGSTPLGEAAAIDLAVTGQSQGKGFGYDATLGKDVRADNHWGIRSKLVIRPSDTLKLTLAGDYYRTDDTTVVFINPISVAAPSGVPNGPISGQNSLSGYPSGTHIRAWGISGKAELDAGFADVTSITSYRKVKNHSDFDVDGAAADLFHLYYDSGTRSFQQELRLSSRTTMPLSWQVGAFYLHSIAENNQGQRGLAFSGRGLLGQDIVGKNTTNSISVFGEATYAVTPTTRLTGGLRWTSDKRALDPTSSLTTLLLNGTPVAVAKAANPNVTFNQVTYRVALRQDLTDDVNLYASVNKGFKSGEFYLQDPSVAAVRPETIMAYEAGLKGDFLDRHLRLNISGFHYNIKDYQIRATVGTLSYLLNAAKVKVDGIDINAEAAVSGRFHLTAGASWLNSRFAQFGAPGTGIIAPGTYIPAKTYFDASNKAIGGDASGNLTALAPHFTLNLGANYTVPLGNARELRLTVNMTHKSSYVFEADNVLRQPAYTAVNASAEFKLSENIGFEAWMRNIGDRNYNVQMVTAVGQAALAAPPRMYGLNFKFNY